MAPGVFRSPGTVVTRTPRTCPLRTMRRMTYAVRWRENDGPAAAGGLLLAENGLVLSGPFRRSLSYRDVRELYFDRSDDPALVLVTRQGDHVSIGSLQGLGALHELADRVAAARGKASA